MCIYAYVCVYVYMYVRIHAHMYAWIQYDLTLGDIFRRYTQNEVKRHKGL